MARVLLHGQILQFPNEMKDRRERLKQRIAKVIADQRFDKDLFPYTLAEKIMKVVEEER